MVIVQLAKVEGTPNESEQEISICLSLPDQIATLRPDKEKYRFIHTFFILFPLASIKNGFEFFQISTVYQAPIPASNLAKNTN